jgi:predicted metal-dependent enzyme (double-stranded beta helix superfamily)
MAATTDTASRLTDAHREAIAACIGDVRAIIAADGVTRAALAKVKARLLGLAEHRDLFNSETFPIHPDDAGKGSTIWLLAEDDDHSFALFGVAEGHGHMSPPHNHTTWAVIAGIEGEELNRFYDRLDDGSAPGRAEIREARQEVVTEGTGVALMPDDVHSIHCVSEGPTFNFHLYGRSIQHIPERRMFNMKDGTTAPFPAQPYIRPA